MSAVNFTSLEPIETDTWRAVAALRRVPHNRRREGWESMIGGFNTNVRYRGRMFHVQTEDSGKANPKIITLLYEGGVILYSKKMDYAQHIGARDLPEVVRELMELQHRQMLRALKNRELDEEVGLDSGAGPRTQATIGSKGRTVPAAEFGEGLITDKPLDELILGHLAGG